MYTGGMSEVLLTNIFFIITGLAVVVFAVLGSIVLYYLIRILRAVRDIAERMREGNEVIAEDVASVREGLVSGRFFSAIVHKAADVTGFSSRTRRSKEHPKEHTKEYAREHRRAKPPERATYNSEREDEWADEQGIDIDSDFRN
jgi:flagellar biosynthesis/type III secretory pathway M-ring protein FliF/YscJ